VKKLHHLLKVLRKLGHVVIPWWWQVAVLASLKRLAAAHSSPLILQSPYSANF